MKHPRDLQGCYFLYKHLGAAGEVLYVGFTQDLRGRTLSHRVRSAWFAQVVRIETRRIKDKALALKAENVAINLLRPPYNYNFKPISLVSGSKYDELIDTPEWFPIPTYKKRGETGKRRVINEFNR